ncbi:Crossover junction endonuclease mus81 [Orobanche minor]
MRLLGLCSLGECELSSSPPFLNTRGVGKWIVKQMQVFFETDSEKDDLTKKGNKNKGSKRYMPQKNAVAYALLVTLFRGRRTGMSLCKKELIDVAETSGLPEKAKGKAGNFGSSPRDWYSGWSCMKTLITRGLVVKSSYPAKYMLTEKGKEVAQFIFTLNDPNSGHLIRLLTVREIKQWVVVDMAIDRGCFIDQSQSLNIHFDQPDF